MTGTVGVVVVGAFCRQIDEAAITQGEAGVAAELALDPVAVLVAAVLGRYLSAIP